MRDFVRSFFLQNKSAVSENGASLHVDLSPELQTLFNQTSLNLVFDPTQVDESNELVTHGSYVFNTIYQHLQGSGRKVVGKLEERHEPDSGSLQKQLQTTNVEIRSFKSRKEKTADILFNFKVSYLSDEKSEEIIVLGIDEHGVVFDAPLYYTEEILRTDVKPMTTKGAIELTRKDLDVQFRACLKAASDRAQENGKNLLHDILKRLHHSVARLKGFYTAQIQELHRNQPSYEERRLFLEREYELKLKEEVDNHKLRIVLKLLSFQIVERSEIRASFQIRSKGGADRPFQAVFDMYTAILDYGQCPTCNAPMDRIVADAAGQIGCSRCLFVCSSCGQSHVVRNSPATCHICGSAMCASCCSTCNTCQKPACGVHMHSCTIGGELLCLDCVRHCSVCQRILCEDHCFVCSATGSLVCFEDRVICRKCRRIYSKSYVESLDASARICLSCNHSLQ